MRERGPSGAGCLCPSYFSMFAVSDYIASLSFVPKWQGIHKTSEKVR